MKCINVNTDLKKKQKKVFTEKFLAIEMKKPEIRMNEPIYLGLSILELGKILMKEFWYDYVKPKYDEK